MKLLLDMDGVVADFVFGAMRLHNKPWPYDDPDNQGPVGWDIYRTWGMAYTDFWRGMGYEFWRNLEPYPWAGALVELAQKTVGNANVAFCSAPAHQEGCIEGKINWCKEYFPDVPVIITRAVRGQDAPKHFLAHNDVVLIDDHDKNIDTFTEHGGQGILFPMPWNKQCGYYLQGLSMEVVSRCLEIVMEEAYL